MLHLLKRINNVVEKKKKRKTLNNSNNDYKTVDGLARMHRPRVILKFIYFILLLLINISSFE